MKLHSVSSPTGHRRDRRFADEALASPTKRPGTSGSPTKRTSSAKKPLVLGAPRRDPHGPSTTLLRHNSAGQSALEKETASAWEQEDDVSSGGAGRGRGRRAGWGGAGRGGHYHGRNLSHSCWELNQ